MCGSPLGYGSISSTEVASGSCPRSLAASLREAGERLGAEADRLVRDVQLTHRELLSELRLPGLAERRPEDPDETATEGRILGEPPRQRPAPSEVFDLPDWVAGD